MAIAPHLMPRRPSSVGWRSTGGAEKFLPSNVVFWRGPSLLTGEPIMCVAGRHTINAKTGPMVQVWILRADIDPIDAVRSGGDAAICGDCKLRGDHGKDRGCYVQWFRAPLNIYRSKRPDWTLDAFAKAVAGKQLRLGAYGDPAAVPFEVWATVLRGSSGWAGYTHQWRSCDARLKAIVMASVDTAAEYREAVAAGWRTFRVRATADAPILQSEVTCPASDEAGHLTTCVRCNLCRGASRSAKNIVIIAHGQPRSVNVFKRTDFEAAS